MNVIEGQANRKKKFSLIFYSLTFNNILNIIVMLILVGVTINVALNGGIFGKAETATRQTEEQAILEEMLAMMDVTNEGEIDYNTIIQKMEEKRGAENVKYDYPNAKITGKLGIYNYIVLETEIRIGSSKSDVDEDLEKYIMGADKTGRPLNAIMDMENMVFIDDPLTEDVDETQTLGVGYLNSGYNEDTTKGFIYAKYNNKAYKITCNITTFKSEKLEVIYEPKGTEGQTTAEGWTILYDNGTTAEAVSPKALGSLRLGYSETATTNETQLTEAIESYNNAIDIINTYCRNLTGLRTNTGVRSVGASSETTTTKYSSDNLAKWNSTYNGVGLIGDINYEQDLVRMSYWEVVYTGERYWMASRNAGESEEIMFCVNFMDVNRGFEGSALWEVNAYGVASGNSPSYAVRPIITIENL